MPTVPVPAPAEHTKFYAGLSPSKRLAVDKAYKEYLGDFYTEHPRERPVHNTVHDVTHDYVSLTYKDTSDLLPSTPPAYEDIILGVCRADDGQSGLLVDPEVVFRLLQEFESISSRKIQTYLNCSERQARNYLKVIRIVIPFLEKIHD